MMTTSVVRPRIVSQVSRIESAEHGGTVAQLYDPAPGKRFLTTTEAARYLEVNYGYDMKPWTLPRWTRSGKIAAHRRKDAPGYRYRYTRESLDALMRSMQITPVEESS